MGNEVSAMGLAGQAYERPEQQGLQPRFHFLQGKGFGEIVVGAGAEDGQFVVQRIARGQHQDRQRISGGTQATGQQRAVAVRQPAVENQGVELVAAKRRIRSRERGREIAAMSAGFEEVVKVFGNHPVVLNDQDTRQPASAATTTRLRPRRLAS